MGNFFSFSFPSCAKVWITSKSLLDGRRERTLSGANNNSSQAMDGRDENKCPATGSYIPTRMPRKVVMVVVVVVVVRSRYESKNRQEQQPRSIHSDKPRE